MPHLHREGKKRWIVFFVSLVSYSKTWIVRQVRRRSEESEVIKGQGGSGRNLDVEDVSMNLKERDGWVV